LKVSNIYERNIQSDLRITEVKGINKTHQREFRERDINVKVFRKDNIYFPSYVDLFFPLTQARRILYCFCVIKELRKGSFTQ